MPCVYLIYSDTTKKFYTGSSRHEDESARLLCHNNKQVRSTKSGSPWRLIHQEYYSSYTEARKRELFLKTGNGRSWIKLNFPLI